MADKDTDHRRVVDSKRWIAALKREREGYVQQGKSDRVKGVDEQLAYYGEEPEKPKGRTAAKKATADKPEGDKA